MDLITPPRDYSAVLAFWNYVEALLKDPYRTASDEVEVEMLDVDMDVDLPQEDEMEISGGSTPITAEPAQEEPEIPPTTLSDTAIDELNRRFADVLTYDGNATFTPSTLIIPKDFSMQMSMSVNHHLALLQSYKFRERYRRLLGYSKTGQKRKTLEHGFDPTQLIRKQAIEFPEDVSTEFSALDTAIHPLFRIENFHNCPEAIYEQLKPGLRLATTLLFHRATSKFWHTLKFGKRELCEITSNRMGCPCFRIREEVSWTLEHATKFKQFIDNQTDNIHFFFHDQPLPPLGNIFASMNLVDDFQRANIPGTAEQCQKSKICFHKDFYTTAKRLSLLKNPDPAMVLRFNFFLASSLCHEMAHFIEVAGPNHAAFGGSEVFFGTDHWAESGIAFECKVFGGRVLPISDRIDCQYGLSVFDFPRRDLYERDENIVYAVPMEFVTRIQRKETWAQAPTEATSEDTLGDFLKIPRTSTCSKELNGVNMMVWEDEAEAGISDELDDVETPLKRTFAGRIVKSGRGELPGQTVYANAADRQRAESIAMAKRRRKENVEWRIKKQQLQPATRSQA